MPHRRGENRPLFLFLGKEIEMSKYFVRDTSLAELERMMMEVPNFAPRRSSRTVLCRYHPQEADMDCHSCHHYRRNGSGNLACLHLTERLQAGMVTMDELTAGMVRPWKHSRLKKRAMEIARRTGGFHFKEQLHIARILKMTEGEASVNSRWLAAVYLLSAHAGLWQQTLAAVTPGKIDFSSVRLRNSTVPEYILYRAAKGIYSGTLGAASEELADPKLVEDEPLLLILCAALIARYGPEVMNVGRNRK